MFEEAFEREKKGKAAPSFETEKGSGPKMPEAKPP